MNPIPEDRFLQNSSYYRKLLTLSEVANMKPETIVNWMGEPVSKSPSQVETDIRQLKQTIDEGRLPEGCADDFNEIIGMRNQLENNPNAIASANFDWDELPSKTQQLVNHQVESSLGVDQELEYPTDEATEWFYRRLYSARFERDRR
ncbi:hypothetical protein [Haloferax sp. DFSO52]|uniref:hypothetical protein n=1 Tax=Haloferax sp. DFSO52 TaxID=3388505 RepID=UPI003A8B8268